MLARVVIVVRGVDLERLLPERQGYIPLMVIMVGHRAGRGGAEAAIAAVDRVNQGLRHSDIAPGVGRVAVGGGIRRDRRIHALEMDHVALAAGIGAFRRQAAAPRHAAQRGPADRLALAVVVAAVVEFLGSAEIVDDILVAVAPDRRLPDVSPALAGPLQSEDVFVVLGAGFQHRRGGPKRSGDQIDAVLVDALEHRNVERFHIGGRILRLGQAVAGDRSREEDDS